MKNTHGFPSPDEVVEHLLSIPPGKISWRTVAKAVCGNQFAPRVVVVERLVELIGKSEGL